MPFTIIILERGVEVIADTAAEAVAKAKALRALGRSLTVKGPEGEPVDLEMLELAVRGKKLA